MPGGDDVVGVDLAVGHQVLDLGHDHVRRGRHDRIEVPRGLAIDQVALVVRLPGMHHRQVGAQAAFQHVDAAVELLGLLALGDLRAGAGARCRTPGMPAPPARMRSASVPCGLNSISSSPARYCCAKVAFSPT